MPSGTFEAAFAGAAVSRRGMDQRARCRGTCREVRRLMLLRGDKGLHGAGGAGERKEPGPI